MNLDPTKIPVHVAIIMDGNGRWARARGLPVIMGHKRGVETVETILTASREIGIKVLTLYAFSTENWTRPRAEVDALMQLLDDYLSTKIEKLKSEGVRLSAIGEIKELPDRIQKKLDEAVRYTSSNEACVLNLALNYGGRREIVLAAREVGRDIKAGKIAPEDVTEDVFKRYLFTKDLPDPDLMIRTSGELRLSNFLLWQLSYSEFYVTATLWPDFSKADLEKAVLEYQGRIRRFGGRK